MSLAAAPSELKNPQSDATNEHLRVPESLENQLLEYRRRVWLNKLAEAVSVVLFTAACGWLVAYALDRWLDTPGWLRATILFSIILIGALVPWTCYRWVWRQRTLVQLARLLSKKMASVGDALLGVIELAENHREQSRSPVLCQAAMRQVAADASKRNLLEAVPATRHRAWGAMALAAILGVSGMFMVYPAAAQNALARLTRPFGSIERFTFTRVEQLPQQWFVPHGEPIEFSVALTQDTKQEPAYGVVKLGDQQPIETQQHDRAYTFVLPPQLSNQPVDLRIGDTIQHVELIPTLRPELAEIQGLVELPEYLGIDKKFLVDARSGNLPLVRGSTVQVQVSANRELGGASVDHEQVAIDGVDFETPRYLADEIRRVRLTWRDLYGLQGRDPFELQITPVEDEPPSLICDGLPRQAVILDSELLKFEVRVSDDYGIRRVGVLWRGVPDAVVGEPAAGERVLAAGGPQKDAMEVMGTFSASSFEIEPQPIELFVWAEDYRLEDARVMSSPYLLYVLTADQHAVWMTEQLSKWHRQALEVRDREMQLYETNKALREMSADELARDENRKQLERQAQAERDNGNRLARLSSAGADLIKQASRNPEIGVGHIENWAEMLQILDDISVNRMPSVAGLLKEAAKSAQTPSLAKQTGPQVGVDRGTAQAQAANNDPNADAKSNLAPSIVDRESSINPDAEEGEPGPPKKPNDPALRLPVTTLAGAAKNDKDEKAKAPASENESLEKAVKDQQALLAEFEKLAEELNSVLANLEGSTLVKRLKAASRKQYQLAGRITEKLEPTFGRRERKLAEEVLEQLAEVETAEEESVQEISYIMDDMAAYFQRRRFARFKTVLDQMKEEDVIGGLRELTNEVKSQQGMSVAQAEYWSDALDRWAEDLVDPAGSGQCPGGKSPESLPPSIVLEVLQILEGEINLREETRVAEQARSAIALAEHMEEGLRLSDLQVGLEERVVDVVRRIGELPDANKHFSNELSLLAQVEIAMSEATRLLAEPNTGSDAIAAETEAIELLLQSKRINPKSGGGGGSAPGGGGGGEGTDAALALVGSGMNQKEVREERDVDQVTGEAGAVLPEEFRSGLDNYFNQLESAKQ